MQDLIAIRKKAEIKLNTQFNDALERLKASHLEKGDLDKANAIASYIRSQRVNLGVESQKEKGGVTAPPARVPRVAVISPVYITKIDEDKGDVLKLNNGGIVEISSGFLGFIGFRKDAVLYKDGGRWKIWIEGKKAFNCDVLKAPPFRPRSSGEVISISEVKGEGTILTTLRGSIYEVGYLNVIETSLWLGNFEALLIDGNRLLNLDEGGEIIDVTKLK